MGVKNDPQEYQDFVMLRGEYAPTLGPVDATPRAGAYDATTRRLGDVPRPEVQPAGGYQRRRRRLTLVFDDHPTLGPTDDGPGLEIVFRPVSFGKALELETLSERKDLGAEEATSILVAELVATWESWNYVDDQGQRPPLTPELLRDEFDPEEAKKILYGWQDAIMGVLRGPLLTSSDDGQPSAELEAQLPMAELSPSLAS